MIQFREKNPNTIYCADNCSCFEEIINILSFMEKSYGNNDKRKKSAITLLLFFLKEKIVESIDDENKKKIEDLRTTFRELYEDENKNAFQEFEKVLDKEYALLSNLNKLKESQREYQKFLEVLKLLMRDRSKEKFFFEAIMSYSTNI